jgi:hypothetical protein
MTRIFRQSSIALSVLALCAFAVAGCGSKSADNNVAPSQAIQNALDKTSEITSGRAKLKGSLALGSMPGSIAITGGGPFDTKAKGGAAFDLEISLGLAGTQQKIGIVALDGKSYLVMGDRAVEQSKDDSMSFGGDQIASFIKGLGKYVSNAKEAGENTYTADVDMKKLIADVQKNSKGADLKIPGLGSIGDLKETVGSAALKVVVNPEGYADSIDINMPINSGGSEGGVRLTLDLTEINQPQTIEKPKKIVDADSALGGGLGSALAPR